MKNFHNNPFYVAAAMILIILSCSKEGEYTLTEMPPLDFKTYYNGLTVTFVNQTDNASGISWNFGDNTPDVSGDSVEHTYSTIGNYVIGMNGTVDGKTYTLHTVLRIDKPSLVNLSDDSFGDWNSVIYPDFQLSGKDAIDTGKIDYDANNVYFFLQYITSEENANLDNGILDIFVDSDNSSASGLSLKGLGCDYLAEGNIVNWFDPYIFAGASQSDWNFSWLEMPGFYTLGYTETSGDTVRMEFSISRESFKIDKDAFQFALTLMNSDWTEIGTLTDANLSDKIQVMMDKQ
jgi:PKD domain